MAFTSEQNEAIRRSGTNIIVSAGAGSGKTAVLSERVINKIENGIHVNELLILTFTKAAANEMKDRIRNKISKKPEFSNELNLLNSAYITTFDSFALSVVKRYHYLLNISSNVSITDQSILDIEEAKIMDNVFEEYYQNRNENFIKLIDKYCVKNDKSLRKCILGIANKINSFIDKDSYFDYISNTFFEEDNLDKIIKDYEKIINDKKGLIRLDIDNMSLYFDSDYMSKVYESTSPILDSDISQIHLFTNVSLPRLPKGCSEEEKASKENVKKSIGELLDFIKYGSIDDIKNSILINKDNVNTICDICKKYIGYLDKYKEENNIYTFHDIAYKATYLVSNFDDVRNELTNQFKEIMIDEYQDTNDIQDGFIKLISNNNVYMVGDIKQSIYRFNGSNPKIFKEKYDNYSLNNGGYKIDLVKNFRSRSEVLNNINRIFELIMDDEIGGAKYKESHEMIYGNTLYDTEKENDFNYDLDILEYEENDDFSNIEIEIFAIAHDIKEKIKSKMKVFDKELSKLRDITYNDFVIILDRSKYFELYKQIFEYLGIPLTILRDDKLNNSSDILLIKNIFDFILRINNKDYGVEFRYDFISIARSFLYEYDDNKIFGYFKNNSFFDSKLFKDFSSIESINSKNISNIFDEVINLTDFYNKIYKIGDYENINVRLNKLYDLSLNMIDLGMSIEDFINYLNDIIENDISINYETYSSNEESVRLMTIHKSKGLEYPICYFADMDHKFNMSDLKDLFVIDREYGLIIPPNMEDKGLNLLKELYKYNYTLEEISEKIRLFYVALTRAREKMIILIPNKETNKFEKDFNGVINKYRRLKISKLSDMVYQVKDYLNEYFSSVNDLELTKNYLYKKKLDSVIKDSNVKLNVNEIHIDNEDIDNKHFSHSVNELIDKNIHDNMKYGTKIHEVFELIDFKNYDENIIKDEYIRSKITNFLNNDLLKNIKNANIYHEYEFEYNDDNTTYHGIIDLMIEYDDYIDIIDFKLKNISNKAYIDQLNGYKKYIEKITNKNVNIYLYSIIDEKIEMM